MHPPQGQRTYFYPRPPRGGRPNHGHSVAPPVRISIHALREEGDRGGPCSSRPADISIHALREEGDRKEHLTWKSTRDFYPRPPRGGRPLVLDILRNKLGISIHALREEGDVASNVSLTHTVVFLSTPSARRATWRLISVRRSSKFLSTPSARRATAPHRRIRPLWRNFYPRPPRGGRLGGSFKTSAAVIFLSTPSARRATVYAVLQDGTRLFLSTPSARRATLRVYRSFTCITFLSTPSARRATRPRATPWTPRHHFYPRPPRGGRPCSRWICAVTSGISIHALREEGDFAFALACARTSAFLSTPSARRATATGIQVVHLYNISIHALREEGDAYRLHSGHLRWYFYPRPPRGGRLVGAVPPVPQRTFLSTPSARRATIEQFNLTGDEAISIHALREEGDRGVGAAFSNFTDFYPRPPRGGRLHLHEIRNGLVVISIHALREEGDWAVLSRLPQPLYFYPRPPRGGRRGGRSESYHAPPISIHALREEGDRYRHGVPA